MRNITEKSIAAFNSNRDFRSSNTRVTVINGTTSLLLHGNRIAYKENNQTFISACGRLSNTTKERLNGLSGVSIQQKNFNWYLNGKLWDGKLIQISPYA